MSDKRYSAVIFDMDGLILDTEKLLVRYWCEAANEYGYPMKREHALYIRSLAGKLAAPYLQKELGKGFDYEKVRARRKALMNKYISENGIELKDGVYTLLDALDERGISKAICTATDLQRTNWYLSETGLLERFDKIVCGPMVPNGKPAPDIYLYACGEIGEKPAACLALEDSPNGIRSACAAGCDVVMVPDLTQPSDEDKKYIIGTAGGLSDVIRFLGE